MINLRSLPGPPGLTTPPYLVGFGGSGTITVISLHFFVTCFIGAGPVCVTTCIGVTVGSTPRLTSRGVPKIEVPHRPVTALPPGPSIRAPTNRELSGVNADVEDVEASVEPKKQTNVYWSKLTCTNLNRLCPAACTLDPLFIRRGKPRSKSHLYCAKGPLAKLRDALPRVAL